MTEEIQYLKSNVANNLQLAFLYIRPQEALLSCFWQNVDLMESPCTAGRAHVHIIYNCSLDIM